MSDPLYEYEYDDDASWARASRRRRIGLITFVTAAVLVMAVGVGAMLYVFTGSDSGGSDPAGNSNAAAGLTGDETSATPSGEPSVAASPPSPSAVPSSRAPSPSKKAKAPPKVPVVAPKETKLPPAPPPPPPSGCKPHYDGTNAAKADVRAALDSAAGHTFWASTPAVQIPADLLYAVAWQESGWQSAIVACDGGIGTMQVMSDTATWMNQRFGTSWNMKTVSGNTMLGGQYLAWLTKYFGDQLVPASYDLDASDHVLLNAVISAYNFGFGAVDLAQGWDGIPNKSYVNNVRALMSNCPCTA